MASAPLKAQLTDLLNSMFAMDFLDEQFKELQMLEEASGPGFLAEVVTLFCGDAERIISQLSVLINEPVVDFGKVDANVHQLKGSSSSVGAKRVALVCVKFRNVCQENDKEGCIAALHEIRHEFDELHKKFQTMLQLEQQIRVLDSK
ncbi:Histidine-containing phosphotransfer protein [Rhynchospora pubera]|uniref:Histidine-containing phosphotransfer protein n=1 Tax=Rhynchospora pubera TaxID=906938 RepID=A0AAV8GF13_9POAL|nr:Histidine-containing phosphotransfer protein [Rhynchospora pubera]